MQSMPVWLNVEPSLLLAETGAKSTEYSRELGIMEGSLRLLPELVRVAIEEREGRAVSYRGFPVGVSCAAVDVGESALYIFSGANVKPKPYNDTVCAEEIALKRVEAMGMGRVTLMVIAATDDVREIGSVSRRASPTLYSCEKNCVPMLESHPVVGPNTLVVTIGGDRYEVHTTETFREFYTNEYPATLGQIPFYEVSGDAWSDALEAFCALRVEVEHVSPYRGVAGAVSPSQLAIQALKRPDRERLLLSGV